MSNHTRREFLKRAGTLAAVSCLPFGTVEMAFAELERTSALVVTKAGQALGVLTRSDLLEFLARQRRA